MTTPSLWPEADVTQKLLAAAEAGDSQAVNTLLERHRSVLVRIVALRLDKALARRVDTSDVVQDALVEAHRRLEEFLRTRPLPFHLWLRQIAHDRVVDAYRRHRGAARRAISREQPLTAESPEQSAVDLAGQLRDYRELTPATAATRRELHDRFLQAVEQLDDRDREIVMMRHFDQLSNQETALTLGLSEPAAGMRYLRAMRRLRSLLDQSASELDSLS